jgi:formate/nitrite transporter FocA (FNT family)
MVLEDIDRVQKEALHSIEHHGAELLSGSVLQQFLLAVSAGGLITFAAALSTALSAGFESWGAQKFMQGLAFAGGFTMVVLSGSALFTEINVVVPRFLLKHWRHTLLPTLSFWGIVWVGNLSGALFTATLLNLSAVFRGPPGEELRTLMDFKMYSYLHALPSATSGLLALGWWQVFCSAILGNWLVGMLAFFCTQARTVQGKVLGAFFPVLTFTALGVQHSTANMGLLISGMIYDGMYGFAVPLQYGWGQVFAYNIIPASLGNVVGAFVMVVLLFSFAFQSLPTEGRRWFNSAPMVIHCSICDANESGEGLVPPAGVGAVHPLSHVTVGEDYAFTVYGESTAVPMGRMPSRVGASRMSSQHSPLDAPLDSPSPVAQPMSLAKFAREFAEEQEIKDQYENMTAVL